MTRALASNVAPSPCACSPSRTTRRLPIARASEARSEKFVSVMLIDRIGDTLRLSHAIRSAFD